jgi:hypothetical protein
VQSRLVAGQAACRVLVKANEAVGEAVLEVQVPVVVAGQADVEVLA